MLGGAIGSIRRIQRDRHELGAAVFPTLTAVLFGSDQNNAMELVRGR